MIMPAEARLAPMEASATNRCLLALCTTVLFWASAFAGIRRALEDFSPFDLALFRFLVASIFFAGLAMMAKVRMPEKRDFARLVLIGLLSVTCYHCGLNRGQQSV